MRCSSCLAAITKCKRDTGSRLKSLLVRADEETSHHISKRSHGNLMTIRHPMRSIRYLKQARYMHCICSPPSPSVTRKAIVTHDFCGSEDSSSSTQDSLGWESARPRFDIVSHLLRRYDWRNSCHPCHPSPKKQRKGTWLCNVGTGSRLCGRRGKYEQSWKRKIVYAFDAMVVSCFVE